MDDLRPHVWTSHSKCHGNNVSYAQALRCLAEVATKQRLLLQNAHKKKRVETSQETSWSQTCDTNTSGHAYEDISVLAASDRICAKDVLSPCSTPASDTSAMDGFAVSSALTVNASADSPVRFRVAGIIAAGADIQNDQSLGINHKSLAADDRPCVEIMTGACFPERQFPQLDAVVKVEDVELVEDRAPIGEPVVKYILVSTPVKTRQHRRPASSDFISGDLIIAKGTRVEPKHVMALTSVGVNSMLVMTKAGPESRFNSPEAGDVLNIGVLPTGSELLNLFDPASNGVIENGQRQRFPDSNGPYILSAVKAMSSSLKVDYLGPCPDDEHNLVKALNNAIDIQQYDVLVTSGGVSMGRFDLVRKVMESRFDAEIVFHGCLVRPGAPVLFGVIHRNSNGLDRRHCGTTTFIGAPGNPIAAAMTVRFFLRPFLKMLQAPLSFTVDDLVQMTLSEAFPMQITMPGHVKERRKPARAVAFLLAKHQKSEDIAEQWHRSADLLDDQASYKIKPFLRADCWVTAPAGKDNVLDGDHAQSYSLW